MESLPLLAAVGDRVFLILHVANCKVKEEKKTATDRFRQHELRISILWTRLVHYFPTEKGCPLSVCVSVCV